MDMATGTNNGDSQQLSVRLNRETREILDGLAKLGVHGSSAADVARHFIRLGIEGVVRDEEGSRILRDREILKGL